MSIVLRFSILLIAMAMVFFVKEYFYKMARKYFKRKNKNYDGEVKRYKLRRKIASVAQSSLALKQVCLIILIILFFVFPIAIFNYQQTSLDFIKSFHSLQIMLILGILIFVDFILIYIMDAFFEARLAFVKNLTNLLSLSILFAILNFSLVYEIFLSQIWKSGDSIYLGFSSQFFGAIIFLTGLVIFQNCYNYSPISKFRYKGYFIDKVKKNLILISYSLLFVFLYLGGGEIPFYFEQIEKYDLIFNPIVVVVKSIPICIFLSFFKVIVPKIKQVEIFKICWYYLIPASMLNCVIVFLKYSNIWKLF